MEWTFRPPIIISILMWSPLKPPPIYARKTPSRLTAQYLLWYGPMWFWYCYSNWKRSLRKSPIKICLFREFYIWEWKWLSPRSPWKSTWFWAGWKEWNRDSLKCFNVSCAGMVLDYIFQIDELVIKLYKLLTRYLFSIYQFYSVTILQFSESFLTIKKSITKPLLDRFLKLWRPF